MSNISVWTINLSDDGVGPSSQLLEKGRGQLRYVEQEGMIYGPEDNHSEISSLPYSSV